MLSPLATKTALRIAGNTMSVLTSDVLNRATTFLVYALVSRHLDTRAFGQLSVALVLFYMFQVFAVLGLPVLITREVAKNRQGFPIPISAWFRDRLRPFVHELLSAEVLRKRGLFDGRYVQMLIEQHESRFADHGTLLWGLMSLELWQRRFLDAGPRAPASRASPARQALQMCGHK